MSAEYGFDFFEQGLNEQIKILRTLNPKDKYNLFSYFTTELQTPNKIFLLSTLPLSVIEFYLFECAIGAIPAARIVASTTRWPEFINIDKTSKHEIFFCPEPKARCFANFVDSCEKLVLAATQDTKFDIKKAAKPFIYEQDIKKLIVAINKFSFTKTIYNKLKLSLGSSFFQDDKNHLHILNAIKPPFIITSNQVLRQYYFDLTQTQMENLKFLAPDFVNSLYERPKPLTILHNRVQRAKSVPGCRVGFIANTAIKPHKAVLTLV